MGIDMLGRLASLVATVLLAAPAPSVEAAVPQCPPGSEVDIGDFIVWVDAPDGGSADVPVWSAYPCGVKRTITFRTYDMSAKAGVDYVGVDHGTAVLQAGDTSTTARVQILGRTQIVGRTRILGQTQQEPSKTFGVRLLSGAKFDDPEGVVTIEYR